MTFENRTWTISEAPFIPNKLHHTETIFTVGNGYMGVRATFEEGYPAELVSTLLHGVFDHAQGELVPELVNVPNPLPVIVEVDGEAFHMTHGTLHGYNRTLDLRKAMLERGVIWRNRKGTIVQITFQRFASLELEHVLAQRITVRALNRPCQVRIFASVDATQTNSGVAHFAQLKAAISEDRVSVSGQTGQSHYDVAVASTLQAGDPACKMRPADQIELQPALQAECSLEKEQMATFYKYSAIHSNRDTADPLAAAHKTLDACVARGWESLAAAHEREWDVYWQGSDVEIEGDETAQRGIRFAIYHVLIAAPRHDEHV
ncbi:MAG TPA: hypothetical protein VKQ72_21745, partial [Aggregatilineales bacterium]|nr:hypothetical protein [Aggregatilineales bacterium]